MKTSINDENFEEHGERSLYENKEPWLSLPSFVHYSVEKSELISTFLHI